jgi:hypothetical protein
MNTWLALDALAVAVLDPISSEFGRPRLTYGFASWELQREVKERARQDGRSPQICSHRDQHAAHEVHGGKRICPRDGAAVDLVVEGVSSHQIAGWLLKTNRVDRMYLYGPDRPLHVSWSAAPAGAAYEMVKRGVARVPRRWKA